MDTSSNNTSDVSNASKNATLTTNAVKPNNTVATDKTQSTFIATQQAKRQKVLSPNIIQLDSDTEESPLTKKDQSEVTAATKQNENHTGNISAINNNLQTDGSDNIDDLIGDDDDAINDVINVISNKVTQPITTEFIDDASLHAAMQEIDVNGLIETNVVPNATTASNMQGTPVHDNFWREDQKRRMLHDVMNLLIQCIIQNNSTESGISPDCITKARTLYSNWQLDHIKGTADVAHYTNELGSILKELPQAVQAKFEEFLNNIITNNPATQMRATIGQKRKRAVTIIIEPISYQLLIETSAPFSNILNIVKKQFFVNSTILIVGNTTFDTKYRLGFVRSSDNTEIKLYQTPSSLGYEDGDTIQLTLTQYSDLDIDIDFDADILDVGGDDFSTHLPSNAPMHDMSSIATKPDPIVIDITDEDSFALYASNAPGNPSTSYTRPKFQNSSMAQLEQSHIKQRYNQNQYMQQNSFTSDVLSRSTFTQAVQVNSAQAMETILDALKHSNNISKEGKETPPQMNITLLLHQRQFLEWGLSREQRNELARGGILADEQGLGKTIQMIALILANPPSENSYDVDDSDIIDLDDEDDKIGTQNGAPAPVVATANINHNTTPTATAHIIHNSNNITNMINTNMHTNGVATNTSAISQASTGSNGSNTQTSYANPDVQLISSTINAAITQPSATNSSTKANGASSATAASPIKVEAASAKKEKTVNTKSKKKKKKKKAKKKKSKAKAKDIPVQPTSNRAGTLVIAPLSVVSQWKGEIENRVTRKDNGECYLSAYLYHGSSRVASESFLQKFDVVLTTYAIVGIEQHKVDEKDGTVKLSGPLGKLRWHRIILDEAQCIKNHATSAAKGCHKLRGDIRWCLTGTPIQNSLTDLFSLFKFLRYIPFNTLPNFKANLNVKTQAAITRVQIILQKITLRRTKLSKINGNPILSLPSKGVTLVKRDFNTEEREFYSMLESKQKSQFTEFVKAGTVMKNYTSILTLLLRLRQACDHPYLTQTANTGITKNGQSNDVPDNEQDAKYITELNNLPVAVQARIRRELELNKFIVQQQKEQLANSGTTDTSAVNESIIRTTDYCPICLDVIAQPVVTDCGHMFCRSCITSVSKMYVDPATGISQRYAPCSLCKTHVNTLTLYDVKDIISKILFPKKNRYYKRNKNNVTVAISTKMLLILEKIESIPKKDKIIVFSQFTSMLNLIEQPLNANQIKFLRIDGSMSLQAREKSLVTFKNPNSEYRVLLISLKAASLGLNLCAANHVILVDPWWNPFVEDQAIDRVHRIGQTKSVQVMKLVIPNTVEERLLKLQEKKRNIANCALGEKKKNIFTQQDLSELFGIGNRNANNSSTNNNSTNSNS